MRYEWRKQRTKWNLLDDPDFYGDQIDPRRVYMITVGGTAANGAYSFDYSYRTFEGELVEDTISFTRAAAEASDAIATALAAAWEGDSNLDDYGEATATDEMVLIIRTYLGRDLIIRNEQAPSGATLRVEGNGYVDRYGAREQQNIASQFSTERPMDFGMQGRVGVQVFPIDANGDIVDIGQTVDVQFCDVVERSTSRNPDLAGGVGAAEAITAVTMGSPEFAEMNGSRGFAVRLANVASAGSAIGFEIWVKASAT